VSYSCTKKETNIKGPVQKKVVSENIQQAPEVMSPSPPEKKQKLYIYDPKGRRDPFIPLIERLETRKKKKGVPGTLESYDVSEFKLVAVASKDGERYALILSPDNKAFTVRKGTVLGLYEGKVKDISDNSITIVEYKKNYRGEIKPFEFVLELRTGEGG
jgi:type IV pilus assembly protein PilP